jgi:glycogen synthase
MAAGRPVVGSRVGGLTDLVADGETGLLVPPGDAGALRAAMRRLLDDPALCERMARAAKRRVVNFQVGAVVPRLEQAYARVLHGSTQSRGGGLGAAPVLRDAPNRSSRRVWRRRGSRQQGTRP